jgi:hypothetical protein
MDARLQKRYLRLVESHVNAVQALAAGIHALPGAGRSFAAAQAAWRFFRNPRVTLPKLIEPLRALGRRAVVESRSSYVLLVHDWSKMDYDGHTSKTDLTQLSNALDRGYEMTAALLVDADNGAPLAPMGLSVWAASGSHTTESEVVQPRLPHLEQVLPWMQASQNWQLERMCVHVIDREADSVKHLRRWDADGQKFLVRADDRRVEFRGNVQLFSTITATLQQEQAFAFTREVDLKGRRGRQFVAETEIVLTEPAWGRTPDGKSCRIPGRPLRLRLIVVQVRDKEGALLAQWWLLTNVCDVPPETVALWYYWRWSIESFHKLLKSAGLELEEWRQESASAIAKRLLVGAMACVTVWQLQRLNTPEARTCQQFLVRLSGRQTKRSRPITTPAMLVGLHLLLTILETLEHYTPTQLREFARQAAPLLRPSG